MTFWMEDQILTLREVAAYLKLAEKTAYRLASEGKLPGFKVGGSWRFKREDLEEWIEKQKDNGWFQIIKIAWSLFFRLFSSQLQTKWSFETSSITLRIIST